MEGLGIFATQARSQWVQKMLVGVESTFGHNDLKWADRALLAIPDAGLVGQELTSTEIEHGVSPLVGMAKFKEYRSRMVVHALKEGIMEPTGVKRRPEGSRNVMPTYRITGYMVMKEDGLVPVIE